MRREDCQPRLLPEFAIEATPWYDGEKGEEATHGAQNDV